MNISKLIPAYLTWAVVNLLTSVLFAFFLFLILTFLSSSARAETIHLKSGKTITAKIIERNDQYVRVDFHGVNMTYYMDSIERISEEGDMASMMPKISAEPVDLKENRPTVIPAKLREPVVQYQNPNTEIKISDYVQMDYSPGIDPNYVIDPTHALNALGLVATKDGGLDANVTKADVYGPSLANFSGVFMINFILVVLGGFVAFRLYQHFKNG